MRDGRGRRRRSGTGRRLSADAGTYVGSRKEDVLAAIPFRIISPAEAVGPILRGVERNRAVIVLPFYARLMWWLSRIHPGLAGLLGLRTIRDFRRARRG